MKSVLISIRPKWCEKICHKIGKDENSKPIYEKPIEVRKGKPSEVPFKAYIYCTRITDKKHCSDEFDVGIGKGNKHIIGEFICDKVDEYTFSHYEAEYRVTHVEQEAMCLNQPELIRYGKGNLLYGWHISDLKIYDKPKELIEFRACNFKSMNGTDVCGNYGCKYYQDSGSYMIPPSCAKNGCIITRPPQSYMFVEELKEV